MTKKTQKQAKRVKHYKYVERKSFYKTFGRKPSILLTKEERKKRRKKIDRRRDEEKEERNKSRRKNKETIFIPLPEVLSLENQYRDDFLEAIAELREHIPNNNNSFVIDHSRIRRIDPEALIILAAEIKRSTTFRTNMRRLKYLSKYGPRDETVKKMLNSIGYWEHFNITKNSSYDTNSEYFKIVHDTQADNSHIVDIREFFKEKLNFLECDDVQEAFDVAITEAIANAVEHGYIVSPTELYINKAWWLSGYYNKETHELFFGCYDQGIGVVEGLKNNDERGVRLLINIYLKHFKKDSDIIDYLIHKPLPKYKKKDRGYGFKQFIKLIEKYPEGSLDVYSNTGHCQLIKGSSGIIPNNEDYKNSINGTLIVWKIKLEEGV